MPRTRRRVCWGYNGDGQASPPSGTFLQVSAGRDYTCARKTDKTLVCWGYNGYGQATSPVGAFLQVSAGDSHTCGIRTDNFLTCWGIEVR